MNTLIIFTASYCVVFASGFQNRNINTHQYFAAAITSSVIGLFNLQLFKLLPNVSTFWEGAAYCLGGSLGAISAMHTHKKVFKKKQKVNHDKYT